ncbi:MAG: nucleoside recognition domain-containing protein [Bacteroidales bacterium]|nr:nucleoside recognition domain-containing protein [Bacteroidales bacterium]
MVLNYIWICLLLIAVIVSIVNWLVTGSVDVLSAVMQSMFDSAKSGFEISIGLTGVLALWLGILKIGERGGAVSSLAKFSAPFFSKLFPEVPQNHPVMGSIFMNISANMLGLDNAATPMGLKAMKELQELNHNSERASNAMVMFLVLNTSGLTLIPITVMSYRAQFGAANPTDVFLPILIATYTSSLVGLVATAISQKINLFQPVIIGTLGVLTALVVGMVVLFSNMEPESVKVWSSVITALLLFAIIVSFIIVGMVRKINVYEAFVDGAKDGFKTAVGIIPYLIAILVAIGMFRASGAMGLFADGCAWLFGALGCNTDFVDAIPTALMKPLSGSGARGMMLSTMETLGPDAFATKVACTIQGATDTTFYILAVYFGSVGITKTRNALPLGLLADLAGIVAAILVSYVFFH